MKYDPGVSCPASSRPSSMARNTSLSPVMKAERKVVVPHAWFSGCTTSTRTSLLVRS